MNTRLTNIFKNFYSMAVIILIAVFLFNSSLFMSNFLDGLTIWATNVLPALFPFMVFCSLLLKQQNKPLISFTEKFFGVNSDYPLFASIICGYPIGAKTILLNYESKNVPAEICRTMCAFCSCVSPVFVFGTINKLICNTMSAIIIYISCVSSALLNGLIWNNKQTAKVSAKSDKASDTILNNSNTLADSILSVLTVGGIVALFYMVCNSILQMLNIDKTLIVGYIVGFVEMTNGVIIICNTTADIVSKTILLTTLVTFGGMAVAMQCMTFLSKCKIKLSSYLFMRITQSALATLISYLLTKIVL